MYEWNFRGLPTQAAEAGVTGDRSQKNIFSGGMSPPKIRRPGRKLGEKNQENERKIKTSSKIFHSQKTNGPKPMSF